MQVLTKDSPPPGRKNGEGEERRAEGAAVPARGAQAAGLHGAARRTPALTARPRPAALGTSGGRTGRGVGWSSCRARLGQPPPPFPSRGRAAWRGPGPQQRAAR